MTRKILGCACIVLALCFIVAGISYAAENQTTGQKAKGAWQRLFNYPANVTNESANVVTDTTKRTTTVVTKEVKRVGQVTSGDVAKTKELVTEPLTGTGETVKAAVEGTANVPVNAAKPEAPAAEKK